MGEYSIGGPRKRFWVGSCNKVPTGVPTMLCVSRMTRITRDVRLLECYGEGEAYHLCRRQSNADRSRRL